MPDPDLVGMLAARLDAASVPRLGRSLALLPLAAGGCAGCASELCALQGPAYAAGRLGFEFVRVPGHADVLLLTGPVTRAVADAVRQVWDAVPEPKWVVAVGDCAVDGGPFTGSYAVLGGADAVLPVDLVVSGCPPEPAAVLRGLRALLEANAD